MLAVFWNKTNEIILWVVCYITTDGWQTANCWPTDGRQSANRQSTVIWQVFWGAILHNYQYVINIFFFIKEKHHWDHNNLNCFFQPSSSNVKLFPFSLTFMQKFNVNFTQLETKLPDFSLFLKYHFPDCFPTCGNPGFGKYHTKLQAGWYEENLSTTLKICLVCKMLSVYLWTGKHACLIFTTLRVVWTRGFFLWQNEVIHELKMTYIKGHKRSFFRLYMTFMHQNRFLMFNLLLHNMVHLHVKYVYLIIITIHALLVIKEIHLHYCFSFNI